jgi:hypothetical protein
MYLASVEKSNDTNGAVSDTVFGTSLDNDSGSDDDSNNDDDGDDSYLQDTLGPSAVLFIFSNSKK